MNLKEGNMKNLKRKLGVGAMLLLLLPMVYACNMTSNGSVADGKMDYTSEELKPKAFNKIDIDIIADVYYVQNDSDQCEVRFDYSSLNDSELIENIKKVVKVVYRDNGIKIGLNGRLKGVSKMQNGHRLKIYVTSPDMINVDMVGVGCFYSESINSDEIKFCNEGIGSIKVKKLLANKCEINNEGVGNVHVEEMKGDTLDIDNIGVGSVTIKKHQGDKVYIDNEGVGKVDIHVDCNYVKAVAEGVGNIHLSGVARQLDEQRDGVGFVKKKDFKILR